MVEAANTPATPMQSPVYRRAILDQVTMIVVLIILATTVILYALPAVAALSWIQLPFLGGFVEKTHAFNDVHSEGADQWPAFKAGVQRADLLIAINGISVPRDNDLTDELRKYAPGQTVTLTVERKDGTRAEVAVGLTRFAFRDLATLFIIPYLIGLVYLGIGVWVFYLRRGEPAGRAFALFCSVTATALSGLFDFYTTHILVWGWTLAIPAVGAALLTLGLVFPQQIASLEKWPWFRLIGFVPMFLLAGYTLYTEYGRGVDPRAYLTAWIYQDAYMGLGAVFFLATVLYRWRFSASPIAREQSKVILAGAAVGFSMMLIWVGRMLMAALLQIPLPSLNAALALPPLVLFPAAVAYAILRYRLLDMDALIGQSLVYALMGVAAIVGYGLILTGISLIVGRTLHPEADNPAILGLIVFILVLVFNPLRERLQRTVDQTFFRGSRAYSQRLEQFGRALTRAVALEDIVRALQEQIEGALRPAHFYLFLRDPSSDDFGAYAGSGSLRRTDIRFAGDGALATTLGAERSSLYLTSEGPLPLSLMQERARLAVLGSAVYAPLPGKAGLAGWLAIGPKLSGEPFSRDDLRFIESLTDQSALAVERATVITDLERRVRELNVLSQMSQAVNFTISYDDLLELIYAQTSKIMDARNFYIILKDARGTSFNYAFYVENEERAIEEEGKPWPIGRGLATEIVRTGQPIRTDDYHAECRRRGVPPRSKNFKAWMGVPLNTGADTIGIMSVAALDLGTTFTEDQLKIFWAIADQGASAMVKARLFQQTEQRARQLATLNEVSTRMASTLTLDPLLQGIMDSSVEILSCEAGSLFLIDEETGEYVFRVAVGSVGQNLIGMRVARGKGFVGEAIESGSALIVNDVQNDPRWFKGSDESTGFITRALMVVPLRRGEHNVGAIEVINKRDGTTFGDDDQNLLTAFAGQAAVAIENARLYTQTDQALTARVEELSIMQRIDRELNTALDVKRVMGLTLDWAMRSTGASAGSVGIVTESGIHIIATEGYGDTVEKLQDTPLPLDEGIMGRVVRTGEINLVGNVDTDPDYRGILDATRSQLTIPIKREAEVVGLINLESPEEEAFKEEQVAFVVRLVDHASVAITNARLYAEVNAANIAKSEFVSLVAHELKTPMTSIRGYADLLLGGAVGSVNDMQKQFLGTIRGNVERMATLVSDLADIARIESGRMRLEQKSIPIQGVIDDVVRTTSALIDGKKQTLTLNIAPDLPNIWADYTRAAQVLTNLVSNAYKYTPESGEIVLRVTKEANQWDPEGAPEVIHIAVKDNGIGIAPEDQAKLFQKFFRAEDRVAREMAPGTGLGLNIVKNLVELQGGKIWFESEFRKGSTFHFTLPIAPAEEKVGVST